MSEITGLDRLPEGINEGARKKLLKLIRRLAEACRAEEARIAYVVRIIGGYEVTAIFVVNPQMDYELALKEFYRVKDYHRYEDVHIRISARYPCAEAPERQLWLKAVMEVYTY